MKKEKCTMEKGRADIIKEEETRILSLKEVEAIVKILDTAHMKLSVVEGCCQNMNSTEADGIKIIAFETADSMYDARVILEEGLEAAEVAV
ncbi:MAG: hypothetical protein WCJ37_14015 [Syntrophus sp. (in: bacteria)]